MELRLRVREQLKKIGGMECYDTIFTYRNKYGKKFDVSVLEQKSFILIKLQSEPKIEEVFWFNNYTIVWNYSKI